MTFLRLKDVIIVNCETVAAFMRYLFNEKRLVPQTIASYKTALASPLLLGWGINVSDFSKGTLKAFSLQHPAVPVRPVPWSLDKVLGVLEEPEYCTVLNIDMVLSICLFLLSLATGSRMSELLVLQRGREFLDFGENDSSVILHS